MITKSEAVPELLAQCPQLQEAWSEYLSWMETAGNRRTDGTDALIISTFLEKSYRSGQKHLLPPFFAFMERLLNEGDPDAKTMADTILKRLRMSLVTKMNGPQLYGTLMGPETRRHWEQVYQDLLAASPKSVEKPRRRIRPERLREYRVSLTRCSPGESAIPPDYRETRGIGTATKLGGEPDWVQGDESPKCPCCNQTMTFVAQIDSLEHIPAEKGQVLDIQSISALRRDQQWMFGDVGMIYVFFCFDCFETRSVFQCG